MTIADIARTHVITAQPKTPVSEVASMMAENTVGSVIVVSAGTPVGIVTDRDIALKVAGKGADPDLTTAADVMTREPLTVGPDTGVFELTALMAEHGVRRVPVEEDTELVGIVTLDDLAQLFARELDNLAGVVESESPPVESPTPA